MTETEGKPSQPQASGSPALPPIVHIGVPIASALILLAFALAALAPANEATLPVQSTIFFVPIYIAIVIVLVFASMYLFKELVDKDVPSARH